MRATTQIALDNATTSLRWALARPDLPADAAARARAALQILDIPDLPAEEGATQ